jgi:F-type H+-transporting ATPase subunit b
MRLHAFVLAGVASLLGATSAFASGGATEHGFVFQVHGFFIINFVAFIGIIVYVGRKPIAAMLDRRYRDVAKEIEAARELKAAAQARYDDYQRRFQQLQQELNGLLEDTRKGTQLEMDRILKDAEAQVGRITAEEQQRLAQESKKLRDQLERDAAAMALRLAEQMVKDRLDAAAQQRLVDRALGDLAGQKAAG